MGIFSIIWSAVLSVALAVTIIILFIIQRNIKNHVAKLKKTLDSLNENVKEKIKRANSSLGSRSNPGSKDGSLNSLRQEVKTLKERLDSLARLMEKTNRRYKIMMEQINNVVELSGMFSGRVESLVKRFLERIQRQKKEREVRQKPPLAEKKSESN